MSQINVTTIQGLTSGADADTIKLNTDSTDRVTVDSTGRVGISTTSHYDTSTKLTVEGRINTSNGTVTGSMNYGNGTVVNIGAMTNHPVQIMSNNQTILRVDTSGLSFDDGSNYLDDYEQGTWTATLADVYEGFADVTSITSECYYQKVGNWVTVTGSIDPDGSTTITTGDAGIRIEGLPYLPDRTEYTLDSGFLSIGTGYSRNSLSASNLIYWHVAMSSASGDLEAWLTKMSYSGSGADSGTPLHFVAQYRTIS